MSPDAVAEGAAHIEALERLGSVDREVIY